jgi:hypothetical protein
MIYVKGKIMKIMQIKKMTSLFTLIGFVAGISMSAVASLTFTGSGTSGGTGLSAAATFTDLGGGQLEIQLWNTYTGDTPDQSHVLTALFFSGPTGLTPVSALAAPGSLQWEAGNSTAAGGMDVGANWEYVSGSGISSAGFGIFSSGNFPPSSGDTLDGSAWGLVSAGYAGSHLDGLDSRIYIQNSVIFVLSGFNGDMGSITDVSFQYGTALDEPNLPAVPESNTVLAGALLLLPLGASTMRILRKRQTA